MGDPAVGPKQSCDMFFMAWICAINPKWLLGGSKLSGLTLKASFDDILHFPLLIQSPIRKKLARSSKRWHPPQSGFLKFNIDGAASGRDGLADIGGVLIKELGEVLMSFSRAVGESYSNTAELLAT
ncbi:hypothetical protein Goshw_010356 [Gossypium schwendimanii]|uniref:RNase H type-1 domain-containing protein n=2 Tax=Gossypium TaxID=3633 RepID=A0A7J9MMC8_GOSSC|nr:hypothetical protein [Gossypium laxum]MBA0872275.1 hypothetical protein [Gossypium schwendimanii]